MRKRPACATREFESQVQFCCRARSHQWVALPRHYVSVTLRTLGSIGDSVASHSQRREFA
jgi:hypothetical protein